MAKIKWRGGAMLSPVPPTMVTCSDGEHDNVFTVAWTGITNTIPPKTYISVRPSIARLRVASSANSRLDPTGIP